MQIGKIKIKTEHLILAIIMLVVAVIRINLADLPLERDEGEFAYMAQLMLKGIPPYTECYNMKMPFIYLIYQLKIMLFGENMQALRFGLLFANLGSILFMFLISKKFLNKAGALFSSFVFAFMTLATNVFGQAAHANHYVTLFILVAVWLMLLENKKAYTYFLSGIFMAIAVFTKQSAFMFPIFGFALILVASKQKLKDVVFYSLGGIFFSGIMLLWLFLIGSFPKFWYFTIESSLAIGSNVSLAYVWGNLIYMTSIVIKDFQLFWITGIIGYLMLFLDERSKRDRLFLLSFLGVSLVSIFPGYYFRHHYYLTLIPAIALGNGLFVAFISGILEKYIDKRVVIGFFVFLFFGYSLFPIINNIDYYFATDKKMLSRLIYGSNPFPEAIEISKYLKSRSNPDDKIAIIGSEAQILFYSQLESATGYIYTYHMVENHQFAEQMQSEMIQEIEEARPRFIVFVNVATSWLLKPDSPNLIFSWYDEYVPQNYKLTGVVDIAYYYQTNYIFDESPETYKPLSNNLLYIWELRTD